MATTDRVDTLLTTVERHLTVAYNEMQCYGAPFGSYALHSAIGLLLEAVRDLAKRNDPLAAEKAEAANSGVPCFICGGSGWVERSDYEQGIKFTAKVQCPDCKGTGRYELPF